jgi:hypothetical protein
MGGTDKAQAFLAWWEKVAIRQRLGAKEGYSPDCCQIILLRVGGNVKGSAQKLTTSPNFHVRAKVPGATGKDSVVWLLSLFDRPYRTRSQPNPDWEKGTPQDAVVGSLGSLASYDELSPYCQTTCASISRLPTVAALLPVGSLAFP